MKTQVKLKDRGIMTKMIEVRSCGACPNKDHKGGFGNPSYIPVCRAVNKDIPYTVAGTVATARAGIPSFCPLPNVAVPRVEINGKAIIDLATFAGLEVKEAEADSGVLDQEMGVVEREEAVSDDGAYMPAGAYAYIVDMKEEGVYGPLGTPLEEATLQALLDLDLTYGRKVVPSDDDDVVLVGMHKARIAHELVPRIAKEFSTKWLTDRGFKPTIRT